MLSLLYTAFEWIFAMEIWCLRVSRLRSLPKTFFARLHKSEIPCKIFRDIKNAPEVYLLRILQAFFCINFNYAVRIVSIRARNPCKSSQKKPKNLVYEFAQVILAQRYSAEYPKWIWKLFHWKPSIINVGPQSNFKQTVSFYWRVERGD